MGRSKNSSVATAKNSASFVAPYASRNVLCPSRRGLVTAGIRGSTRPPNRRTGHGRRGAGCRQRLRQACRACGRTHGKPRYALAPDGAPHAGQCPTPGSLDHGRRPGPESGRRSLLDIYALEYTGAVRWRHYGGGVDEDRLHVAIVVMGRPVAADKPVPQW